MELVFKPGWPLGGVPLCLLPNSAVSETFHIQGIDAGVIHFAHMFAISHVRGKPRQGRTLEKLVSCQFLEQWLMINHVESLAKVDKYSASRVGKVLQYIYKLIIMHMAEPFINREMQSRVAWGGLDEHLTALLHES